MSLRDYLQVVSVDDDRCEPALGMVSSDVGGVEACGCAGSGWDG